MSADDIGGHGLDEEALTTRLYENLAAKKGVVIEGPAFSVSSDQVHEFGRVTWLDKAYPNAMPDFPDTIVEGFLLLSLVDAVHRINNPADHSMMWALNYGLDRVRFVTPVHVGDLLKPMFEILAVEKKAPGVKTLRRCSFTHEATGELAMVANWWGFAIPRGVHPRTLQNRGPVTPRTY